jgi:DNA-binding helix-hairpin-helix protein with protein kinase domain
MHGTANQLTDHTGRPLRLGRRVGGGGEGEVFEVAGRQDIVAKVYHQPLTTERAEKIKVMIPLAAGGIRDFCAWPAGVLLEGQQARGILMPYIKGKKELHLLHGPKSRKAEFPDAGFGFLLRVATNIARAIASLHAAGVVIGDINDRGFLVGPDGRVSLIDCDSFQIITPAKAFLCDVGVPNFTPPELQGHSLRGVRRMPQHDAFGLAVLIFLLIFMGRHPFAGRYARGSIELEVAIKECRYAYSSGTARTCMEAPPNTLAIESGAGREIKALFERAFAPSAAHGHARPAASDWIDALERLEKALEPCHWNRAHVYARGQPSCPWCALEQRTGVDLFSFIPTDQTQAPAIDVEAVWQALGTLKVPGVPKAKPALHFSTAGGRPLPAQLAEKMNRYRNLELEAKRAMDVAHEAGRRAETTAGMRTQIHEALVNADPKLRGLKEYRDLPMPNDTAQMLFLGTGALLSAGFVADGLSAVLDTAIPVGQALLALMLAAGVYLSMRRWYLAWSRASAGSQLAALLQAAVDSHAATRAQIDACMNTEAEAQAVQENATKLAGAIERDMRLQYEAIRQDIDLLKTELDRKVSECSAELRRAAESLAKIEVSAKELEKDIKSRHAAAAQSVKQWRDLETKRLGDLQKLRNDERMQQLDGFLDQFFIDQTGIQGIPRTLKAALRSYGIETAADVTEAAVDDVPGFGPVRTKRMIDWRRQCAQGFVYVPGKAIDAAKVAAIDRRHLAERRRIERDLKVTFDLMASRVALLTSAIGPAKQNADRAVDALVKAKVDRKALDRHLSPFREDALAVFP